jgi:hypothetical protein
MTALKNKTILILSPQSWGKMFVSKHHYAVELTKHGNTVYFLNPPDQENKLPKGILIEKSDLYPGLNIVSHRLWFPYNLKFHFLPLFHFLMKGHVKKMISKIGHKPDIIWSFDLGNLYPFRLFPHNAIKIFHPVDEPLNQAAINSAKGADIIFSVTKEILAKYESYDVPKIFINHGVSESFIKKVPTFERNDEKIRVGFSGNLLRADIDRSVFLQIISEHPEIIFECWGSYQMQESNIGGSVDQDTVDFIKKLQQSPNVQLHGVVPNNNLSQEYERIDAFLICYDINKDQSSGTNYHKVMEYLSTGKVIISNNITTYRGMGELIQMTNERDTNTNLPALFSDVIKKIEYHNTLGKQQIRINFSRTNTYGNQLEKIQDYIFNSLRTGN